MATFDKPGDAMLTPDGKSIVLATGPARVKQRLKVGIQTILGSYRYNTNAGLPWFEWFDQGMRAPIEVELRRFFNSFTKVWVFLPRHSACDLAATKPFRFQ